MEVINEVLNWIIAYEFIALIVSGVALGVGVFIEWIKEKDLNG